jgi:hypothetical protein
MSLNKQQIISFILQNHKYYNTLSKILYILDSFKININDFDISSNIWYDHDKKSWWINIDFLKNLVLIGINIDKFISIHIINLNIKGIYLFNLKNYFINNININDLSYINIIDLYNKDYINNEIIAAHHYIKKICWKLYKNFIEKKYHPNGSYMILEYDNIIYM